MCYKLIFVTGSFVVLAVVSAQSSAQTFRTLLTFDGADGASPQGSLIVSGSTLYGMTESGGTHQDGTAFSLAVGGGTPTTLFNFDGTHGQYPIGDLMLSGSTLYGMAWQGGINGDGTVFSLPAGGGTPTTLYSFDGTYGASPQGSLILSGSTLYGMTVGGGSQRRRQRLQYPRGRRHSDEPLFV